MSSQSHEHELGTQRIEAFSDAVFAIAITLLIIEIAVPHLEGEETLGHALRELWPSYGAYLLSFIMIGIYWANHHFLFRLFLRTDHIFLMLNVFFLVPVAFLPFPTAVLGEYLREAHERDAAVSFYCLGLLLPAVGWLSMWFYAKRYGLVDQRLTPDYVRFLSVQYLLSGASYVGALALSFVNAWAALGLVVGLTLLYLLPPRRPRYIDGH
jgi:uncharacterized membrane protein